MLISVFTGGVHTSELQCVKMWIFSDISDDMLPCSPVGFCKGLLAFEGRKLQWCMINLILHLSRFYHQKHLSIQFLLHTTGNTPPVLCLPTAAFHSLNSKTLRFQFILYFVGHISPMLYILFTFYLLSEAGLNSPFYLNIYFYTSFLLYITDKVIRSFLCIKLFLWSYIYFQVTQSIHIFLLLQNKEVKRSLLILLIFPMHMSGLCIGQYKAKMPLTDDEKKPILLLIFMLCSTCVIFATTFSKRVRPQVLLKSTLKYFQEGFIVHLLLFFFQMFISNMKLHVAICTHLLDRKYCSPNLERK